MVGLGCDGLEGADGAGPDGASAEAAAPTIASCVSITAAINQFIDRRIINF
jgi:hypothetical protein